MKIPHSRPYIDSSDIKSVTIILKKGILSCGEKVKELEEFLKDFYEVKGAVCVSSGTSALHLSLISLGIKSDDSVLLPAYMCSAPLNAVNYVKAEPILFDITEEISPSPEDALKKRKQNTKAVILPHLFGLAADIDEFTKLNLPIIEDCAHSIGCHYKGKLTGKFGILSILSFYATKMVAGGEGGAVLSNDLNLIEKIRDLREYDEKEDYKIRFNYKMTDMQAALILSQFRKIEKFIKKRKELAFLYTEALKDKNMILPKAFPFREHIFFRYIVISEDADNILKFLNDKGIRARRPVFKPLSFYLGDKLGNTEKIHRKAVSIPIYPSLRWKEIKYILKVLKSLPY